MATQLDIVGIVAHLRQHAGDPAKQAEIVAPHIPALISEIDALTKLVNRFRYATAFAAADAWDGAHDMRIRFTHADALARQKLGDFKDNELAELGQQFLREFGY